MGLRLGGSNLTNSISQPSIVPPEPPSADFSAVVVGDLVGDHEF